MWRDTHVVSGDRISRVADVTRAGSYAVRVEVRPGDKPAGDTGNRAEVLDMTDAAGTNIRENESSGTVYYGFSVQLDPTWQTPAEQTPGAGTWAIVLQLHGPDVLNASPAFAIHAEGNIHVVTQTGDLDSVTENTVYALSENSLNLGYWSDFIIKIVYAKGATGSFEVWRRNEGYMEFTSVLAVSNVPTLQYKTSVNGGAVGDHYWAHGLYEPEQTTITNVLWLDGIARGTSYDAILTNSFPAIELPQNLLVNAGTLVEDFEVIGDWTASEGSVADDATNFKTGSHSIAITSASGASGRAHKTVSLDMSAFGRGMCYFRPTASQGDNPTLYFSSDSGFSDYIRYKVKYTPSIGTGWHAIHFHEDEMEDDGGSPNLSSIIRFRCRHVAPSGQVRTVNFDSLYLGMVGVPTIYIQFEDIRDEHYDAAMYMAAHHIRGNFSIVSDLVGTSEHCTWAQLREMEAAGHCLMNSTKDHTSLATLSEAAQEAEMTDCRDAGKANGIWQGDAAENWRYLSYPNGSWNADTLTAFDAVGMRLGWNVIGAGTMYGMPFGQKYMLPFTHMTISKTIGELEALVDECIDKGMTYMAYLEDLGGTSISLATFETLIDYMVTVKHQFYSVTADDLYRLQSGYVTIPLVT